MKTQEQLNFLKEEAEKLNKKLEELTEEELAQVTGGKIHLAVGGCGISHMILENNNLCTEAFTCNFMEVNCPYRP